MALSISTTNVLTGQTPVVTDPGTNEIASNISSSDHSLTYTCGTAVGDFQVDYGAQTNISYVGISGHTAATPAPASIELYDGAMLIDSVALKRNNNVMFTFSSMSFTNLIVKFITVPNNFQMTVSFIAAGQHLTIATGEQAGYKRNWLNRPTVQRTTTNFQVGPVSSLTKKKSLKGTLSLPNEAISFVQDEWQDFIDFAFDEPFFIKEVTDKPESSYICFDPAFDANAHAQTRKLDMIKLKFTVFNGL